MPVQSGWRLHCCCVCLSELVLLYFSLILAHFMIISWIRWKYLGCVWVLDETRPHFMMNPSSGTFLKQTILTKFNWNKYSMLFEIFSIHCSSSTFQVLWEYFSQFSKDYIMDQLQINDYTQGIIHIRFSTLNVWVSKLLYIHSCWTPSI